MDSKGSANQDGEGGIAIAIRRPGSAGVAVLTLLVSVLSPAAALGRGDTQQPEGQPLVIDAGDGPTNAAWKAMISRTGALGSYHHKDGTLVVVVPASGSSTFTPSDASDLGLNAIVESRDVEPSDVAAIDELLAKGSAASEATVNHAFIPRLGKVIVWTDADRSTFDDGLDAYAEQMSWEPGLVLDSRYADYDPHWGGSQMKRPGSPYPYDCTAGFSVRNAAGNPRMVTAGHCWIDKPVGTQINSPGGDPFGEIKVRASFPTYDFQLDGLPGIGQQPYIYTGGGTGVQTDVVAAGDPDFAHIYCYSGATTFEGCSGDLVDDDYLFHGADGDTIHTMLIDTDFGDGPCFGDSGAPVYRYLNPTQVVISGIVTAGGYFQTSLQCQRESDFYIMEPWSNIRDILNVTIKTI